MSLNQTHIPQFYDEILRRLESVRRKGHRMALFYGVLTMLLITLVLLTLISVVEQLLLPGIALRTGMFFLAASVLFITTIWLVLRPLLHLAGVLKSETNFGIASTVGKYFPAIHDRLLDTLQMYEGKEHLRQLFSTELIDASLADLYQQIHPLDFTQAISDIPVRKAGKLVAYVSAVVFLTLIIFPGGFFSSFHRIFHFDQSFAAPLLVQCIVEPGNTQVVRGEDVPITIRTMGKLVKELSLLTRPEGQLEFDKQQLKSKDGIFRVQISSLKLSTDYYAAIDEFHTDTYKITVLDRPMIRSLHMKVTPPAYTHLPSRMLDENIGDINAYAGSTVAMQLLASKGLTSAVLVHSDSTRLMLDTHDAAAGGTFTVRKNRTYHILLTDTGALQNLNPVEYTVSVIADEYPTAEILSPAKNLDLTQEMKLDIFLRIKDDFGFSKLRLAHRLVHSRYEQPSEEYSFIDIPIPRSNQNTAELWYHWDLTMFHLVPEDALSYFVEVLDNDNVNGPKSGRSATYLLRVPSLEEVFSDVAQAHQQSLESMQDIAKETKELKKEIESLQNDAKTNREKMSWQQKKKAEEMVQRYESMKNKLQETSQKLEEMLKKTEENKLLSPQTMEKYLELQKLMEQLNSPELREALKKLQESMKQLSPEQMRQAMEQLKASEEQFRQNLERTIELLKRIHIEQKLEEVIKRTEELMKQQDAIKQEAAKTKASDQKRGELAQHQRDLRKPLEELEKETGELKKKMEEFAKEMPVEEMKKAQEQLQQQQLQQKMEQSSQQMKSGDMEQAQQQQQQTIEGLNQFKNQMQEAQQALRDKQLHQIVNQMRKQLDDLLELSKREESLKNETESLDPNSQRFRQGAEKQMETLTDLGNVASAMSELSKKTFAISPEMGKEIGNALNQMNDAMQSMEGRNPAGSSQKQNEAMGSLNRAAMMMQNALNGLMQGGQGGMGMAGLMGQLQQMAGRQRGINAATQEAMGMGEGNGQGLSAQQQAEYQRLGGQQAALQKSLEELSREAKNAGDFSKLLGDIDQVAREMQEVQTDLEQGDVNPVTTQRQERILSRLLESSRSLRERDYEKKRVAESGKTTQRTSPDEIDLTTQEGKDYLREELLKVLEQKYSRDYEDLIKDYFEQLGKQEPH